ncbi:MAG: cupin domain-containing protein [Desulfobacterales bacterium]
MKRRREKKAWVESIIEKYGLEPLSGEGGWYARTYRSNEVIQKSALPKRYESERVFGTAIYYLLTPETYSALHRLPTDEIFHFYLGDPVTMLQLYPDGTNMTITLGQDILNNDHHLQTVVPWNTWQGTYLEAGGEFALLGATMAPGFESIDLELGDRDALILKYPERKDLIFRLTAG